MIKLIEMRFQMIQKLNLLDCLIRLNLPRDPARISRTESLLQFSKPWYKIIQLPNSEARTNHMTIIYGHCNCGALLANEQ